VQIYFGARRLTLSSVDPTNVVAAGFGVAAYALMFSAFQVLNAEGQALWILFTLPARIDKVLLDKARLWGGLAFLYPLTVVVLLFATRGPTPRLVGLSLVALAGVPIFATIATAFGVLAWDPALAVTQQRRLRPAFVYLYMSLAAMYTFALYASDMRQRAILTVLTGFVALALWQKARDHLPYLLDTTAAPPARVSIADGLIAALLFFVAQGLVALGAGRDEPDLAVLIYKSFIWGGAITFATVRFVHWRTHAKGVPTYFGPRPLRAIALGLGGAVVAAVFGVAYLLLARRLAWFPAPPRDEVRLLAGALAPLAIVAAPIFEEYIFRGLLFGGLARSVSPGLATLASAAIFAMVHPPLAMVPVFFMALVAATVYARAGILLAPVLVHAGYNAAVVVAQAWFGL
jgi:ABC-2 type transport system permease protein